MTLLLERILQDRNTRVRFRALGREHAHAQIHGNLIEIDLRSKVPAGKNYIHEMIHYFYPDMPHRGVYALEKKAWAALTNRESELLYKKIFS